MPPEAKPQKPGLARRPPPAVGAIRAITFNAVVRCGNRTLYPNGTFIPKEQRMEAFVDDRDQLWVGYEGHWTRVPWESTGYVSYWPADEAAEGEAEAKAS